MKLPKFRLRLKLAMRRALNEIVSVPVLTNIKDDIVDMIKVRVTAGFGVRANGRRKEKLSKLSKSYKKARKRLELGPNATQNKSNLHLSGDMIEKDLDGIVDEGKIIIGFKTDRSAEIAAFVSQARPFLFLSGSEIKKVKKNIELQVRKIIEKHIKSLG